jgi:hypothetical protein
MDRVNFHQRRNFVGKNVFLDIILDQIPFEQGASLQKLERIAYENNPLFVSTFDYLLAKLKSCSALSNFKLLDSNISLLYCSELSNSYNLVFCFFTQLEGDCDYLYFEAEINTIYKYLTNDNPKILKLSCYRIEDEYKDKDSLKNKVILALNNEAKYRILQVKNIISAKYINGKLMNPENFVVKCQVLNSENVTKTASITMTNDSISHNCFVGNFEYIDYNCYSNETKDEIFLDIEIFPEHNQSNDNFKLKETKKFLDNKSTDSLLQFIEKKIFSSNLLRKYNLDKRMYINSVEKRENSQNNNDFILEFFKKTNCNEFILFNVKVNVVSKNYKLNRIRSFLLSNIDLITNNELETVKESLLTLDEEYQLVKLISVKRLIHSSLSSKEVYSCYLTVNNQIKNNEETGFLLIYKRLDSIATASAFIKDEITISNGCGFSVINESNYMFGQNTIVLSDYYVISQSQDIKSAIKYITEQKLLKDVYYKKELIELVSAIELTFQQSSGNVLMKLIFISLNKDKTCFFNLVKLLCSMKNNVIAFENIKNHKLPFYRLKKQDINLTNFQNVIDQSYHAKSWESLRSVICTEIIDSFSHYNKFFFNNHYAVKFMYMKDDAVRFGLLTYSEEGVNIFPVCFYEMKNEEEFIDYSLLNVNKEVYDFQGNHLLEIVFNNVLNILPEPKGDFNVIHFPYSKMSTNNNETLKENIRYRLKEKFKTIEFQNNDVKTLFSLIKYYENGVQELISYLTFNIKFEEIIICELTQSVSDYLNKLFELKGYSCFLLKAVKENDYPSFQEISNVLWANTYKDYKKIIITKVRSYERSSGKGYLKCIYYIEFKHYDSEGEYSFMYGTTSSREVIMLKDVEWVCKNVEKR